MLSKLKVLFLCTGNSCRSQMAEGWAKHVLGDGVEPRSAGINPGRLDRRAVEVMDEAGVDIANQWPKPLSEVMTIPFDLVITVCDGAAESCPVFPGSVRVIHRGFDDPPRLAARVSNEEEAWKVYRRVRDEIRAFVETLPELMSEPPPEASETPEVNPLEGEA